MNNDESFILLVRTIQYEDIVKDKYKRFNSLYDIAMTNNGNYIPVNNNYELRQEPPDPFIVDQYKRRMNIR